LKRKKKKKISFLLAFGPEAIFFSRGPLVSRFRVGRLNARASHPAWADSGRWPNNRAKRAAALSFSVRR
jgi:hypothetical protein